MAIMDEQTKDGMMGQVHGALRFNGDLRDAVEKFVRPRLGSWTLSFNPDGGIVNLGKGDFRVSMGYNDGGDLWLYCELSVFEKKGPGAMMCSMSAAMFINTGLDLARVASDMLRVFLANKRDMHISFNRSMR